MKDHAFDMEPGINMKYLSSDAARQMQSGFCR
jgi:hypothetical protein